MNLVDQETAEMVVWRNIDPQNCDNGIYWARLKDCGARKDLGAWLPVLFAEHGIIPLGEEHSPWDYDEWEIHSELKPPL